MTRRKRGLPARFHVAAVILLLIPVLLAAALCIGVAMDETTERVYNRFYPLKYIALVELAAERWDIPSSVILGVIHTESGFDENALSHAGAVGLMQMTDDTYDWIYFLRREECPPHDTMGIPAYNIDAGAFLLSWLYRQYGRWDTVFAAYNAGYARVNKWLEDPEITKDGVLVNIPINETKQYVARCTEAEEIYRTVYAEYWESE
ncbi:MAG: lytic transglycosylase domain-containing protein [Clostridia bacterium]|nr:lytic transglycosylase domain-containing protein [Clostridia bacterium]